MTINHNNDERDGVTTSTNNDRRWIPGSSGGDAERAAELIPFLRVEIARLENSLFHLRRSNEQLEEALQAGPDPEYESAINENLRVIASMEDDIHNHKANVENLLAKAGEGFAMAIDSSDGLSTEVADEQNRTIPRSTLTNMEGTADQPSNNTANGSSPLAIHEAVQAEDGEGAENGSGTWL